MRISIIIPTFNEAENIAATVRYLQKHGGMGICEIIVVDGGSTDDTVSLASEVGAQVCVSPEKGRGPQMNFGVQNSQGDVLYFVHADTRPPETFVQDIEKACMQGWTLGNFRYRFDSDSWLLCFNASFTRFSFMFCQGGDKTLFVRRELFIELGGYDPRFVIMEEYDFLRRAQKKGHRWVVLPRICIVSARKYKKNSWLRVQIANIVVFNLWVWRLAEPPTLKRIYGALLA
jgi:rSAM/selenodomain-associated transferase 2